MISEDQPAANRSTGPRTEEGKANSSRNAIKHGAFAKTVLLPGESQAEFDALHAGLIYDHSPVGETETDLVQGLAEIQWRLNRLRYYETASLQDALEAGDFSGKALLNCTLIEQRLLRSYQTTIQLLKDAQTTRLAQRDRNLRDAAQIREYHLMKDEPWNPQSDGFVFSLNEIDSYLSFQWRLEKAAELTKPRSEPGRSPLPKAA